ncbi:MAG: hypothetical protein FIB01_13505 [Gemmatimonadetes bacterium]|nr:hypothetical protein [Gemmatimonadota bacterium]
MLQLPGDVQDGQPDGIQHTQSGKEEHDRGELGEDRQHDPGRTQRREPGPPRGEAGLDEGKQQEEGAVADGPHMIVGHEQLCLQPGDLIGM